MARSNTSISGLTSYSSIDLREILDELRRVLVDLVGEIHRAGGERGHVGLEVSIAATLVLAAAAAAGRELDDHAGAVLAHALLHLREQLRIGRRAFVLVAHMDVHQRGAGLVGLVRRFDLLGRRHRHGRRLRLARQRAGDGDGDDGGCVMQPLLIGRPPLDEMERLDIAAAMRSP